MLCGLKTLVNLVTCLITDHSLFFSADAVFQFHEQVCHPAGFCLIERRASESNSIIQKGDRLNFVEAAHSGELFGRLTGLLDESRATGDGQHLLVEHDSRFARVAPHEPATAPRRQYEQSVPPWAVARRRNTPALYMRRHIKRRAHRKQKPERAAHLYPVARVPVARRKKAQGFSSPLLCIQVISDQAVFDGEKLL